MSVYLIKYNTDGHKVTQAVNSAQEYRQLRDTAENIHNVALARQGDEQAKRRLVQFCYNSHHPEGLLAGESLLSRSFGFDYDDPDTREVFIEKCMKQFMETGLLMLERSVKGAHAVFQRRQGESILEAQYRVARQLDVEFDNGCKDQNRVFFSTTASPSDLVYLSDALFYNDYDLEASRIETQQVKERVKAGEEHVPSHLLSACKHAKAIEEANEETDPVSSATCNGYSDTDSLPSTSQADGMSLSSEASTSEAYGKSLSVSNVPSTSEALSPTLPVSAMPAWTQDTEKVDQLMQAIFRLCGYEMDDVQEGVRNSALFAVLDKLRHLCEFNPVVMKAVVYPRYSFGLDASEIDQIVRSVLKHERGYMSKELKFVFDHLFPSTSSKKAESQQVASPSNANTLDAVLTRCYPSMESCVSEEVLLPKPPKYMKAILKMAPQSYVYPLIAAVTPAMATLMTDCTMKFGPKAVKRLNAWTHLDGHLSSNKGLVRDTIHEVMYEVKRQDHINQEIMNAAIRKKELNKNKQEQEEVPSLPIVMIPANITRKKHIQTMQANKGAHTFTVIEELDSLGTNQQGYYNRADFERYMFDNGEVGSFTAVNDSENLTVNVAWNVLSTCTRDQTMNHWKSATDGAVSRVWFVLMPNNLYESLPQYEQFDDDDKAYIHRGAIIMRKLHGLLKTPKLDKVMLQWLEDQREQCFLTRDAVRDTFRKRAAEIAHTFGGVLMGCDIVQSIMDREDDFAQRIERQQDKVNQTEGEEQLKAQEELALLLKEKEEWDNVKYDVTQYRENYQSVKLARFMVDKIVDTQIAMWGDRLTNQFVHLQGLSQPVTTSGSLLDELPNEFDIDLVCSIRPEISKSTLSKTLQRLCTQRHLMRVGTKDRKTIYRKVGNAA